jgi:signal transduction histidine kinase
LSLGYDADAVRLTVEDTRPPDTAPPGPSGLTFGGYGLTGMRERAELLGGTLTAEPTGQGFLVVLWLPTGRVPRQERAA